METLVKQEKHYTHPEVCRSNEQNLPHERKKDGQSVYEKLLIIREIKIKITILYYFTPMKQTYIKKSK